MNLYEEELYFEVASFKKGLHERNEAIVACSEACSDILQVHKDYRSYFICVCLQTVSWIFLSSWNLHETVCRQTDKLTFVIFVYGSPLSTLPRVNYIL